MYSQETKHKMKKYIGILIIVILAISSSNAQITIEPEEWLPCEEITLTIDITQGDCQSIIDSEGPLFLWSWMPAEPVVGNGEWANSNDALQLTNTGDNLWSITMVPTDFYGVTADEVYANGFAMLVKARDGGGGADCSVGGGEFKTSDFTLEVAPPFKSAKIFALPQAVFANDIFTFRYDNTLETKETMQNLDEVYVYAAAVADGTEYPVSAMEDVGSNPDLEMSDMGNGQFALSIIPEQFFSAVPAGTDIDQLIFIVRKKEMTSSDDRVDEDALFDLGCDAAGGGC